MASIDDFKKKAKDTFETIADVSVEAYKVAEDKARVVARWTKLNAEIAQEKTRIRRLEGVIGKKYYELHNGSPEEELRASCEGISASLELIAINKKELADMKKPAEAADVEAEAEACDEDCCDKADCCSDSDNTDCGDGNTGE